MARGKTYSAAKVKGGTQPQEKKFIPGGTAVRRLDNARFVVRHSGADGLRFEGYIGLFNPQYFYPL
ncbi:MAG: hypothetical protein K9M10_00350 [Candidatus Pacebacteria bacterium]|nr:hypothetical protein [Candidatus Paceibacterota bacterium]MCF7856912.1 hypothetical protein [Candidatus Paceibacterota bacterium]